MLNEFFTGVFNIYGEGNADSYLVLENGALQRLDGAKYFIHGTDDFVAAIYSVYWQQPKTTLVRKTRTDEKGRVFYSMVSEEDSFYTKWYSHLNYTKNEYQKIATQLWYWRTRILELATVEYPITKYCLDIQGNSLILVQTFGSEDEMTNPFLMDLMIVQTKLQDTANANRNEKGSFCDDPLRKPSELWIRWKSNPIALPAFDVYYDLKVGDQQFDLRYRSDAAVELGQLTHTNNDCNENFKLVLNKWREKYANVIDWSYIRSRNAKRNGEDEEQIPDGWEQ